MTSPTYSMVIQWSNEDEVYIVTLPEFDNAKTHGETYEKAARQGRERIESFLIWHEQDAKPLPAPLKFDDENHAPLVTAELAHR
ncbi:MAG: type II toxin-antitoxin system HicB family antitoxin [Tepidisphaeraceae bacterium]